MHIDIKLSNRIGIFSDIHGNLHALDAVLQYYDAAGITDLICCGDIVGYGAFPNECVERMRERNILCVAGNHDFAALNKVDITYFNPVAKRALYWTREQLTKSNLEYLEALPLTLISEDALFVHASPRHPEQWNYIITMSDARQNFRHFGQRMCFLGHSHTPFIVQFRSDDETLSCVDRQIIKLQDSHRYLFNVGSLGQPRDCDKDACFAILDRDAGSVEIRRVSYDVTAAQQAIRDANLPGELADRLMLGM